MRIERVKRSILMMGEEDNIIEQENVQNWKNFNRYGGAYKDGYSS